VDASDAIESDFSALHRVDDCWTEINSWVFWKRVWYLPAYIGATKVALRAIGNIGTTPASSTPAPEVKLAQPEGYVSPEAANVMAGGGLISFGSGG
jgi:hypothetical protein